MTDQEKQKLNEKLNQYAETSGVNYVNSLAPCFEYLLPKLKREWGNWRILPSLALCLAIEKLIDGGKA